MTRDLQVLLADDNDDHRFLVKHAIESMGPAQPDAPRFVVHDVRDGEEATAFVRREGRYALAPRPDLVLLDVKMPRKDGFAVLADLKSDPLTRAIPIVMLSSSENERDVARAYALGSNSYVTKPLDPDAFERRILELSGYWTSVATLPEDAGARRAS